jgi:DNA-binding transcriptional LysR family regulator
MIITMREVNIAGIDLNLVPALDALLRHRNVTRAAAEVGLSQPAMSRALSRLRDLHGDPLLVRTRGGYVLTPRAREIQPQLAQAIRHLRGTFQPRKFDPGAERRTIRLAATDTHTVLILPGVMARLAAQAPGVEVRVESYRPGLYGRLETGELDLAFALSTTPLPPGIFSEAVAEDRVALVMRRHHPAAKRKWTLADYGRYPHVGVAILGDGQSEIDAALAAAGVNRRIGLVTPHFTAALATVAATDMVTTLSATLARRFAAGFGLVLRDAPLAETRIHTTLVCAHIRAADPFLAWFRALVKDAAAAAGMKGRTGLATGLGVYGRGGPPAVV